LLHILTVRFPAFIGDEWTSQETEPYTTYPPAGSTTPEDLWKALNACQEKTGGRVLATPHDAPVEWDDLHSEVPMTTTEPAHGSEV